MKRKLFALPEPSQLQREIFSNPSAHACLLQLETYLARGKRGIAYFKLRNLILAKSFPSATINGHGLDMNAN